MMMIMTMMAMILIVGKSVGKNPVIFSIVAKVRIHNWNESLSKYFSIICYNVRRRQIATFVLQSV